MIESIGALHANSASATKIYFIPSSASTTKFSIVLM
jgi:hypothetical protein